MLPILPAILLLFLQGPAHLERLAHEGRLPAGFDAVRFQDGCDDRAIVALLASSNTTELSSAILALLEFSQETPTACERTEISTFVAIAEPPVPLPHVGFAKGQRSRDGPSSVV